MPLGRFGVLRPSAAPARESVIHLRSEVLPTCRGSVDKQNRKDPGVTIAAIQADQIVTQWNDSRTGARK